LAFGPIAISTVGAATLDDTASDSTLVEAQGGLPSPVDNAVSQRDRPGIPNLTLGDLVENSIIDTQNAELCIGERINSLRQILKRFEPTMATSDYSDVWPAKTATTYDQTQYILPWNFGFAMNNTGDPTTVTTIHSDICPPTLLNYFASAFRFFRGSMRLKIQGATSVDFFNYAKLDAQLCYTNSTYAFVGPWAGLGGNIDAFNENPLSNMIYNKNSLNGAIELETPFYSYTPFVPTHFGANFPCPVILHHADGNADTTDPEMYGISVHRAVGDDFEFGFYTGCPPVAWTTGSTATTVAVVPYMYNNQELSTDAQFAGVTVTVEPQIFPAPPFVSF